MASKIISYRAIWYLLPGLLCLAELTTAQSYLYPIRQNHLWGFIDGKANMVIPPQYDVLGDEPLPWFQMEKADAKSPFRLVEVDGQLGLIDQLMRPVLEPRYQRIRALSLQYFSVTLDSAFTVVDRQGTSRFPRSFREVRYLGTTNDGQQTYFTVRDEKLWGVWNATGQEVLPMMYTDVKLLKSGGGMFAVRSGSNESWGLVNRHNEVVLPAKYVNIWDCSTNFYATQQQDKLWQLWDSLGQPLFEQAWRHVRPFNRHFIALHDTIMRPYLYQVSRQDTLPYAGKDIHYNSLDDRYILRFVRGLCSMLDSTATPLFGPTYRDIRTTSDPRYYKVAKADWGLYDISQGAEVLACNYYDIGPFEDGYALVYGFFGRGVINSAMQEIIPMRYEVIQREDHIFKAFRNRQSTIYEVNDDGQVINIEDYGNVRTIRVRREDPGQFREAKVVRRTYEVREDDFYMRRNPSPESSEYAHLKWQFDPAGKQWSLRLQDSIPPRFYRRYLQALYPIEAPAQQLVAQRQFALGGPFAKLAGHIQGGLAPLSMYSEGRRKLEKFPLIVGLRRHDFERRLPYAATIDAQGLFGLIDTAGREVTDTTGRPLRFTYIGEFSDGYARVCLGGRLKHRSGIGDGKISLEPLAILLSKFCVTPIRNQRLDYTRLVVGPDGDQMPLWGVIDINGNMIIEPQYEYMKEPIDQQLATLSGENWGVISVQQDTIIPFQYASISDYYGAWRLLDRAKGPVYFNERGWQVIDREFKHLGPLVEDRCRVRNDSMWGYFDGDGRPITGFRYTVAKDFSEGRAAVREGLKWKLIDLQGREIGDLAGLGIDTLGQFSDGLCWFKRGNKYGYLDASGKVAIDAAFGLALDFKCGRGRVVVNRSTVLIDRSGKIISEEGKYQRIDDFNSDCLALANISGNAKTYVLLDTDGKQLTPLEYEEIGTFGEGFAPVRRNGLFGLINRQGKEVIPPRYERIRPVSHGLAAAMIPNSRKWIFMDTSGRQLIKKQFDKITADFDGQYADVQEFGSDFSSRSLIDAAGNAAAIDLYNVSFYHQGTLGVSKAAEFGGTSYYYSDLDKEPLIDDEYESITPFKDGIATIQSRGRRGLINQRGLTIIRPKYVLLQPRGGLYLAGPPAFGIADRSGKIIIPADYDSIEYMSGEIYRVEQGERVGYIDTEGNWLWPLQN